MKIDSIAIDARLGTDRVQTNVTAGILNIEGLRVAGIFGIHQLISGYLEHILVDGDDGMFSQITINFTDPNDSIMGLDVWAGNVDSRCSR